MLLGYLNQLFWLWSLTISWKNIHFKQVYILVNQNLFGLSLNWCFIIWLNSWTQSQVNSGLTIWFSPLPPLLVQSSSYPHLLFAITVKLGNGGKPMFSFKSQLDTMVLHRFPILIWRQIMFANSHRSNSEPIASIIIVNHNARYKIRA